MATIADSYSVKRAPAKAQMGAHPAFPAVMTFVFAALLGVGTLMVPVTLIERLVSLTGLANLLASAAPPLGVTARAGIALAGAIVGALVGLALARRVTQSYAVESRPRRLQFENARQCRPISVHDELGEDGIASTPESAPLLAQRRHAPAVAEGTRASPQVAPVPAEPAVRDNPSEDKSPAVGDAVARTTEPPDRPPSGLCDRPLAELGLLQLTERLGASLSKRKATGAENSPATAGDFEAAQASDAARAVADFFDAGRSPQAGPGERERGEKDSLPATKIPFIGQQEFVRLENPHSDSASIAFAASRFFASPGPTHDTPAGLAATSIELRENPPKSAVSPAIREAAHDPAEAARNLRAALATLERMSGAA